MLPWPRGASVCVVIMAVMASVGTSAAGEGAGETEAACEDGASCLRMAEVASKDGHKEEAARLYARACDRGRGLGCIFLGNGLEPDAKKRAGWLRKAFAVFTKACDAGEAEGCYYLGISYERASGTTKSYPRSLAAYHKGCAAGSLPSCTNEAGMYLAAKGGRADRVRAAELYASACRRGDSYACYWLGRIYDGELGLATDSSAQVIQAPGLGVEARMIDSNRPARPSPAKSGPALAALLRAHLEVDKGCSAAPAGRQGLDCYLMGLILQVGGPGVTKNDREALGHYERACAAGNGWACLYAGDAYQRGYGVKPDHGKASSFYLKACDGSREGFREECEGIGDRMMM